MTEQVQYLVTFEKDRSRDITVVDVYQALTKKFGEVQDGVLTCVEQVKVTKPVKFK
jgi:hypothetical protein